MMRKNIQTMVMACAVGMAWANVSWAIPALQLFVEGATYDPWTESWLADFSDDDPLRLWAIGNLDGAGGKGTIFDVKLAIAYSSEDSPTFSLTESTTGGYGGFTDPSVANEAEYSQTVTDGSVPKLSNGKDLPAHGIYGPGISWTEYNLGHFDTADALGGDFINSMPTPEAGFSVNVYEVAISGTESVHFDLYDSYQQKSKFKAIKAPFSHDAYGGSTDVPDGGLTLSLMGLALLALERARRRVK